MKKSTKWADIGCGPAPVRPPVKAVAVKKNGRVGPKERELRRLREAQSHDRQPQ